MPHRATRVDDVPNRDVLDDLAFGLRKAAVLKAALELEIFTRIAEGHHTVPALARIGGLNERGTRVLLDALVFIGLLIKQHSEYKLSATGEAFLVKGKPTYFGDAIISDFAWDARSQLARTVRTGKTTMPPAYTESTEPMWSGIAAATLVDWERQMEEANAVWDKIGVTPEGGKPLRIADIGAGSGILPLSLAKRFPSVRVTAIDRPMVLTYTRQVAEYMQVAPQLTLVTGDALTVELKPDAYDVVFFGNLTDYLSPEQNIGLFRKAFESLAPNGRVVIDAPVSDDDRRGPGEVALAGVELLLFSPDGDTYTFAEYRGMLETVGFSEVTGYKDDWGLISARRLEKPPAR